MNQHVYREKILKQYSFPFYDKVQKNPEGEGEIDWVEDNARYHNTVTKIPLQFPPHPNSRFFTPKIMFFKNLPQHNENYSTSAVLEAD